MLQDYILHEKMAHFNRDVFGKGGTCKGSAAFGTFTAHDINKYTKAKMFSKIGKETKFCSGSQWAEKRDRRIRRDRGFAINFIRKMEIGILWVTIHQFFR
jgi:catalase